MSQYALVYVNDLTYFVRSNFLGQNIALVTYSVANKQWVAECLGDGPYSDRTLMTIAKLVYKKNKETNPEYSLAT